MGESRVIRVTRDNTESVDLFGVQEILVREREDTESEDTDNKVCS